MKTLRIGRISILLILALAGCHDRETSTAPGALANVRVDAPESARSGETFTIDVSAVTVGINNVRNGRVEVMLPAPLSVVSVEASSGTAATFSNGAGGSVSWNLNTLDSNSQSRLHIQTTGVLPSGSVAQSLTIRASMTADGVHSGDAVAQDTVQLLP
ncbi:MAG: hypothetical protein M3S32_03225 [Acidobacteriota bacterium]|nr:hypothetical protein [Acidobacteriota bacterium]